MEGVAIRQLEALEAFKQFIRQSGRYDHVTEVDYSIGTDGHFTFIYVSTAGTFKERYSHIKENNSYQLFYKQAFKVDPYIKAVDYFNNLNKALNKLD